MTSPSRTVLARAGRAGFSLIELLVVIVIIAIVIAITVPAIGGARDLARAAATQSQLANLTTAISAFQADEQRLPGYFNARTMGEADTGFSAMQNILLELAGGPIPSDSASASTLVVGPNAANEVDVNLNLVGVESAGSKSYFQPSSGDYLVVVGKVATGDTAMLPELVDSWGMPILAWAEDEFAPAVPETDAEIADFAAVDASGEPARFYWQQNAGLLSSTGLGPRETTQLDSLLYAGTAEIPERMAALLGSTADPVAPGGDISGTNVDELIPGSARGGIVLQSAGRDRVFLSSEDSGLDRVAGNFLYGRNFSPTNSAFGANPWPDADGSNGATDIAGEFNDVITSVAR